ncbi:MAG: hypothetical protein WDM70_11600 [Nitrosomonadales bacterium]
MEKPSAPPVPEVHDIAPAVKQPDIPVTQPVLDKYLSNKDQLPVTKRHPLPVKEAHKKETHLPHSGSNFQVTRLMSRASEKSARANECSTRQQKLLDADDQMVRFLAMQHQVKQLQDELGAIKSQLAQLDANTSPCGLNRFPRLW